METPDKAEPDYYEEEIVWRRDARAFACGLLNHWLWWTGSTIAGGIAALWQGGGHMIPGWLFLSFALSGLVIASFLTFRDQRRVAESKGLELAKEKRQRELEQNDWVFKTKDFYTQIASLELQLDEREKRKTVRAKLSDFLVRLELRITEIRRMFPSRYVASIDETMGEAYITTTGYEHKEFLKKLTDKASLSLAKEIHDYLESIETGKGSLFLSHTGMERSEKSNSESIEGIEHNKKAEMLDHLQHRAKNLLAIIKALE